MVINGFYMVLQPVSSGVPQGRILGPTLLNIINDLYNETESNHSTKLGAEMNTPEGRAILESWTGWKTGLKRTVLSLTKTKARSCTWGRRCPVQAGICVTGKQPCGNGCEGHDRQQAECDLAMCCCSNEANWILCSICKSITKRNRIISFQADKRLTNDEYRVQF